MRVYVIRHGESEGNQNHIWSGWLDTPLTDKGREDAKKAGEFLRGISFDKIYSSDLCRAVETAKIATEDGPAETDPRLREIDLGSWTGQPHSSVSGEELSLARKVGYKKFGGESMEEFCARIGSVMKDLENAPFSTVALFSHGGFMRSMLHLVLGTELNRKHLLCNNCAIAVFDYTKETWRLHSWINLN